MGGLTAGDECPCCGNELVQAGSKLVCSACNRTYGLTEDSAAGEK
jgi:uncharacterized Zn finger protein (UPF0148 family)